MSRQRRSRQKKTNAPLNTPQDVDLPSDDASEAFDASAATANSSNCDPQSPDEVPVISPPDLAAASSLPSKAYSASGGLFRLVRHQCRGRALTLRLRTVFLFVPQPVAACLKILVAARRRSELASILLSEQLPSACSYLAAKWQLDVAHTPSETFARWYMTRLTCGLLLLEACRQCPSEHSRPPADSTVSSCGSN